MPETLYINLDDGFADLYLEGMEGIHYFRVLRELVEKLVKEPQPTLAKLTGIWLRIERVVTKDRF